MTQGGPAGQLAIRSAEVEPTAAELLDPVALERRLTDARARRAEALARRRADEGPDRPPPARPLAAPAPAPRDPTSAAAAPRPSPPRPPLPRRRVPMAAIFLAGLALGAGVVLLLPRALGDRPAAPAPAVADPPAAAAPRAAALPPGPAPAPPAAAPAAPAPFAAAGADAAAPAPAAPVAAPDSPEPAAQAPAWAGGTRVHLYHPPDARAAAELAAAALQESGVTDVHILPARVSISRTNVRYYHAGDAEAAQGIVALLPPDDGAPPLARDFTDFRPPPNPGMVEVWLAGEAPAARGGGRVRYPVQSLPGAAQDVAEQVARIVMEQVARTLDGR